MPLFPHNNRTITKAARASKTITHIMQKESKENPPKKN
jgi:hypothetical protein